MLTKNGLEIVIIMTLTHRCAQQGTKLWNRNFTVSVHFFLAPPRQRSDNSGLGSFLVRFMHGAILMERSNLITPIYNHDCVLLCGIFHYSSQHQDVWIRCCS
jgi:hypothetical protein